MINQNNIEDNIRCCENCGKDVDYCTKSLIHPTLAKKYPTIKTIYQYCLNTNFSYWARKSEILDEIYKVNKNIEVKEKMSINIKNALCKPEVKQKMQKQKSERHKQNLRKPHLIVRELKWINNGIIRKRVKLEELKYYLNNGFILGKLLKVKKIN